jgi:hypothetical protein
LSLKRPYSHLRLDVIPDTSLESTLTRGLRALRPSRQASLQRTVTEPGMDDAVPALHSLKEDPVHE